MCRKLQKYKVLGERTNTFFISHFGKLMQNKKRTAECMQKYKKNKKKSKFFLKKVLTMKSALC